MNAAVIRAAAEPDRPAIAQLHRDSFGPPEGDAIAQLVLDLLDDPTAQPCLSLLAEGAAGITGHVLFTPVAVSGDAPTGGYIMAPLAVAKRAQKQGLGRRLIAEGCAVLTARGAPFVLVLGDPAYYTANGFHAGHGLRAPHALAYPEAWMVRELQPGALAGIAATVTCAAPLQSPEHW